MKSIFERVIQRGNYDLTGILKNIDAYHIEGKLTDVEREELYALARHEPKAQYDMQREIEKIWAAIRALQKGNAPEDGETSEEWPEYVQPTGAHDAYNTGDKVTYSGEHYVCKMDNCVWSPDVYPDAWDVLKAESDQKPDETE